MTTLSGPSMLGTGWPIASGVDVRPGGDGEHRFFQPGDRWEQLLLCASFVRKPLRQSPCSALWLGPAVALHRPVGPFHDKDTILDACQTPDETERRRHMPGLTLGQAARIARRSKATLSRDIAAGRLHAVRNPGGTFSINPRELSRMYPNPPVITVPAVSSEQMTQELDLLRETIGELRKRLDVADQERAALRQQVDQMALQLVRLLTPKSESE
jgi:hypothetical protein